MSTPIPERLSALYSELVTRNTDTDRYERYLEGEAKLTFATPEWKQQNEERFANLSDNWCDPVISAEMERLIFNGVEIRGHSYEDREANRPAEQRLWDYWLENDVEARSAQGFETALAAKYTYVIVWDDGNNEGNPLATWEHPGNVIVQRDPANPNNYLRALKSWQDDDRIYATLYEKDWLYKYEKPRHESGLVLPNGSQFNREWVPRGMEGVEPVVVPNPLGVIPVVEIPNRPNLRGEGKSELAKVIPLQDAINVLWAYTMHAADYAAMPARVLLNTNPPMRTILDKDGNPIGQKPVTMDELNLARMAVFNAGDGSNATIDQWDPSQLSPFTDVIEIAVAHIAAQTRTPPHYLVSRNGMSNLSGEALVAAETGLVKKCEAFMLHAGPALRRANVLMAMVAGDRRLIEAAKRSMPTWENPAMRSDAQVADAQVKRKQVGYSMRSILAMGGMSPAQIDEELDQQEVEQRRAIQVAREFSVQELVNDGYISDVGEAAALEGDVIGAGADQPDPRGVPAPVG